MNSVKKVSEYIILLLAFILTINIQSQWIQQNSGSNLFLTSVNFINENTGFITSNNTYAPFNSEILRTINGGENWITVFNGTDFLPKCIHFFNENTGITGGGFYASQQIIIYKTINNGQDWFNISPSYITGGITSFDFIDSNTGYASVINKVIKTTNGGANWILLVQFTSAFSKLDFTNLNSGWVVYNNGGLLQTSNAGLNWTTININTNVHLRDVQFLNDNTGYIAGDNGKCFKTTNGGANWEIKNLNTTTNIYALYFINSFTGFAAGNNGVILKTINEGESWTNVSFNSYSTLSDVQFLNENTGYIVGDSGVVYKTTTGGVIGIEPISTEIPDDYSLYQNYPNPFNPTTNIKFSIPKAAFVTLAVYDMLGREIQTLVNENLSPATYEVKWDAAKFSSGIYFYKLLTPDFALVKKMSVIK